ncbi:MAG: hypothetical protein ABEI13_03705 [Candidatus Paceibacteria bacterium]
MSDKKKSSKTIRSFAIICLFVLCRGIEKIEKEVIHEIKVAIQELVSDYTKSAIESAIHRALDTLRSGNFKKEFGRSVDILSKMLDISNRRKALKKLVEIAEKDGIILKEEKNAINVISYKWSIKNIGDEMIEKASAVVQKRGEDWSLLHELAFLFILVFHSSGNEMSNKNIDNMIEKLHEWSEGRSIDETREVFRRSLQVYANQPQKEIIKSTIDTLKKVLPKEQRLLALDDINKIMRK